MSGLADKNFMTLRKRTIRLAKHNTSIALEAEFWNALDVAARRSGQTVPMLVAAIDAKRTGGLASAIRVAMLELAAKS